MPSTALCFRSQAQCVVALHPWANWVQVLDIRPVTVTNPAELHKELSFDAEVGPSKTAKNNWLPAISQNKQSVRHRRNC